MNQELEKKIRQLLDIEDIKILKRKYAGYCDDNYNPAGISELFTEDAIWDGGPIGFAETRQGIKEYFATTSDRISFAMHYMVNPIIEVEGDEAKGQWYLWQPMTIREGNQAMFLVATYDDIYVRQNENWLFKHVKLSVKSRKPYQGEFG